MEVALLRIGHLLHKRGKEFVSFADLIFADRRAGVSPKFILYNYAVRYLSEKLFLIRSRS